jgi:hypothetical protein
VKRSVCNILVLKPERKIPHGRHKHRWEDNNKLYLHGVGLWCIDGIEMAQDRDSFWALVNTLMNIQVLLKAGNFLTS